MRRIGIYSGTFDPVHPGHVAFALESKAVCELDEVIFLPERDPRGKAGASSMHHRIQLLGHALEGLAGLRVLELASEQFTVSQTLPELQQLFTDASLVLLAGSDVIRTFPYRWEGLQELLEAMPLAIGIRAGDAPDAIDAIIQELQEEYGHPIERTYITTPEADLASTHIRNGTADLSRLHPATRRYIEQHGLYAW